MVWQADSLAPLKVLDYPEKYYENHIFTNSINHITVLTEVYPAPRRVVPFRDLSLSPSVAHLSLS